MSLPVSTSGMRADWIRNHTVAERAMNTAALSRAPTRSPGPPRPMVSASLEAAGGVDIPGGFRLRCAERSTGPRSATANRGRPAARSDHALQRVRATIRVPRIHAVPPIPGSLAGESKRSYASAARTGRSEE